MRIKLAILLLLTLVASSIAIPIVDEGAEGEAEAMASKDPSQFQSPQCKAAVAGIKWKRRIPVRTSTALQNALNSAKSGDVIELAPGIYSPRIRQQNSVKRLTIKNKHGTRQSPIVICGPRSAILSESGASWKAAEIGRKLKQSSSISSTDETTLKAALSLVDVSHVHVRGLKYTGSEIGIIMNRVNKVRVTGAWVYRTDRSGIACKNCEHSSITKTYIDKAFRGIVLDYSSHNYISDVKISNTGNCGFKFRRNSTHNVVTRSEITDTGKINNGYGEGFYIGSAKPNSWYQENGRRVFKPDRSDYNVIAKCKIGPGVTSEMVDAKALTAHGKIIKNTFQGQDISFGTVGADSWAAINGNDYLIAGNSGSNTRGDGFNTLVHIHDPDFPRDHTGYRNKYRGNSCDMKGSNGSRFCISIIHGPQTPGHKNVVECGNNRISGPGKYTNIPCKKIGDTEMEPLEVDAVPLSAEFVVAEEVAYLAREEAEAQHDEPPPPGWLDAIFGPETA